MLLVPKAKAAIEGRDYVIPDDVKTFAVPVLSHRIILKQEFWYKKVSPENVVKEILQEI